MPTFPDHPYIHSVDLMMEGRIGTPFTAEGRRDYQKKFRVIVRNKLLDAISVCSAPTIPFPWAPFMPESGTGDYDLLARVVRLHCEPEHKDDWQNWIITVDYSTQLPAGGVPTYSSDGTLPISAANAAAGGGVNNPELEPIELEYDFEVIHRALQKDMDGKPFINSAGQPFTPAPTFEMAHPILVMSRNEMSFNMNTAISYAFAVNSDLFMGYQPGTVQCYPPKARQQYIGGLRYFRVTYKLRFAMVFIDGSEESWQPVLLDQGTMEKQTTPGAPGQNEPTPIISASGALITQPVLLDGAGKKLKKNAAGQYVPKYIFRRIYQQKSFAALFANGLGGF